MLNYLIMKSIISFLILLLISISACEYQNNNNNNNQNPIADPILEEIKYNRKDYKHWIDQDKDCQNTRQEVLVEESLVNVQLDIKGCKVIEGKWYDPYTDQYFTNPSDLDIDHFIPLKETHISGGQYWSKEKKKLYANNLLNQNILIAVHKGANRSKSYRDPSEWMPKNTKYHCEYIKTWINIKKEWNLTMDKKEEIFIVNAMSKCD